MKELRNQTFALLQERGFSPAPSLPLPDAKQTLRPSIEIASRLTALDALFKWVAFLESEVPSDCITAFLKSNQLTEWLTQEERAIVSLPRSQAHEQHVQTIGWKLENMWPLAWALGHPTEPAVEAEFMDYSVIKDFLSSAEGGVREWLRHCTARSLEEVIRLEYQFYCAHNAVRSAQMGQETVPDDFDPVLHGGVICERRHALTWCLSPGVAWEHVDLST
jgi:hypothetical protein